MKGAAPRTERLVGTPLAEADWPDFRALLLDPRVSATIGGVRPEAESADTSVARVAGRAHTVRGAASPPPL